SDLGRVERDAALEHVAASGIGHDGIIGGRPRRQRQAERHDGAGAQHQDLSSFHHIISLLLAIYSVRVIRNATTSSICCAVSSGGNGSVAASPVKPSPGRVNPSDL